MGKSITVNITINYPLSEFVAARMPKTSELFFEISIQLSMQGD